jgi:hypothetical protein
MLPLWACGQRGRVVHHVHGGRRCRRAPDGHRRAIAERLEGDYQQLDDISGQINYGLSDSFKVFGAFEYNQDYGHAYWGTPLTTTAFSGPFFTHSVVAGSAINTFDGSIIATIPSASISSGCAAVSNWP